MSYRGVTVLGDQVVSSFLLVLGWAKALMLGLIAIKAYDNPSS